MQVFDASSMIYAWDNYPIDQFPSLWDWLGGLVQSDEIVFSEVAFDEIEDKAPDCAVWLTGNDVGLLPITNEILLQAKRIKVMLGWGPDQEMDGPGVGENDLFIIGTALCNGAQLVSDEAPQLTLPQALRKYKIPAVCKMETVEVDCINFLTFLKNSREVF